MRYGMVIDLKRCIGCQSCTAACKVKNGMPPGLFLSKVLVSESGTYPAAKVNYLPVLCNHCGDAACATVCPVGATYKRTDGIIAVDADKCIGCRYCMVACPYGARQFVASTSGEFYPGKGQTPYEKTVVASKQTGVVTKCDFCADRLAEGREPACVQTCPAFARIFGDMDDPNSEASRLLAARSGRVLKPESGTEPNVYYVE